MIKLLLPAFLFGLLLLAGGITIIPLVPYLVEQGIRATFRIETPWSPVYQSFHNSSAKGVEQYRSFTFFSVMNPENISNGELAKMKQMGPYTYREYETYNESMTTWHTNGTFSYRSYAVYEFHQDLTGAGLTEDDLVTIPSMSLLGFFKHIRYLSADPAKEALEDLVQKVLIGDLIKNEPLFVTKTVRQLIKGFSDPLMGGLNALTQGTGDTIALNPDSTPESYLAEHGNDEAYTGGGASSTQPDPPANGYRWMTKWRGMESMPGYWKTDYANKVSGTDATAYHPFLSKDSPKLIWVNSLVRKVNLTYLKDVEVKGVTCWRHIIDPVDMKSAANNPENDAYYMDYDGWLPAPPSMFSRPTNYTKPNFLDADRSIVNISDDPPIVANRDIHETYIDIEPRTGSLFQVAKRLQANVLIEPMSWLVDVIAEQKTWWGGDELVLRNITEPFNKTQKLVRTYLPVFWLDQHMTLPDNLIDDFKDSVENPILYSKAFGGLAIAIGIVLIIATVTIKVLDIRRARRNMNDHEFYRINNNQQQQGYSS